VSSRSLPAAQTLAAQVVEEHLIEGALWSL
jgi:hypothetical protein